MKTEEIFSETLPAPSLKGNENCLAVGTRLSDFEITGVLGEGGFGIVYLAFDHSLQRTVAIKEYMPGTLAGRIADGSVAVRAERHQETFSAGLKSFISEARLLAQFDHSALVKVYRFWEENKTAYMAMRHYDGNTLKDIVINRPERVTEAWLRFIFKQILDGLETLYASKILHRDVSPDNIIVQKNGDAVLLDFGSARQIIGDMTKGLTVILKPGYAPVEQYADDDSMQQGPWTDIYSLAAVMYFAIVKEPPPMSVGRMVKDGLVPLHKGEHPGFSEKFLLAIDQALSINPTARPQSMDEFRRLLGIRDSASSRGGRSSSTPAKVVTAPAAKMPDAPVTSQSVEISEELTPSKINQAAPSASPTTIPQAENKIKKLGHLKQALIAVAMGLTIVLVFLISASRKPAPSPNVVDGLANGIANAPNKNLPAASDIASNPTVNLPSITVATSLPAGVSTIEKNAVEEKEWMSLVGNPSTTIEALQTFLTKYPQGKFVDAANAKLLELNKVTATAAAIAPEAAKIDSTPLKITVKLAIRPWGTIFVDGVQSGVTPPLKKLSLTAGKHKIKVTNPGFADFSTEIVLSKKNTPTIEHEFISK